jgi:tetratricopeptide (TPR) repeat protein
MCLNALGRNAEALNATDDGLRMSGTDQSSKGKLYYAKAVTLEDLGRSKEAAALSDLAINSKTLTAGQDADCHRIKGQVFYSYAQYDDALAEFELGISLYPDHPSLHSLKGQCFVSQGRFPEAIAAIEEAIKVDKSATPLAARAICLKYLNRLEEAANEARIAVSLDPRNAFCNSIQGQILFERGRFSEAIQCFAASIASSNEAESYLYKARCELQVGRTNDAWNDITMALHIEPTNPEIELLWKNISNHIQRGPPLKLITCAIYLTRR